MQKNQNHVRPLRDLFLFSAFLRRECKFFINTSNMHLVNSFMNLYTCLLDEIAMQDQAEGADRMSSSQVCTIWTDTIRQCYYPSDVMWVNLIRVTLSDITRTDVLSRVRQPYGNFICFWRGALWQLDCLFFGYSLKNPLSRIKQFIIYIFYLTISRSVSFLYRSPTGFSVCLSLPWFGPLVAR